MKRTLTIVAFVAMAFTLPKELFAQTFSYAAYPGDNVLYYTVLYGRSVKLTYQNSPSSSSSYSNLSSFVSIPDSVEYNGQFYYVTEVDAYAFYGCGQITNVSLPVTIETIGDYAFGNCTSLQTINLPKNLFSIAGGSFNGCTTLSTINYEADSLSYYFFPWGNLPVFDRLANNAVLNIASNVKVIPAGLFDDCGFKFINFNADSCIVVDYGEYNMSPFYGSNVQKITFGNGVRSIPNGLMADNDCDTIEFGASVAHIGDNVISIGDDPVILYNGTLSDWCNIQFNGYFGYSNHQLYIGGSLISNLIIPESVNEIKNFAFHGVQNITSVIIPGSIMRIGKDAFSGCATLHTVSFPNSIAEIDDNAFSGCSSLDSLVLPNQLLKISYSTFSGSGISSITIPQMVRNIGHSAFRNCIHLKSLNIASSVDTISPMAFYGCDSLEYIVFEGINPPTIINSGAFSGIPTSIPIYVPCNTSDHYHSVLAAAEVAFYNFIEPSSCNDDSAPNVTCIDYTNLQSSSASFYYGTYGNPFANEGVVDYGSTSIESRHTICSDTTARDIRTGGLLRTIPEGFTSSFRLGNWGYNTESSEAEGVVYNLQVDTTVADSISVYYAVVLQDALHAPEEKPHFRIEILDSIFQVIITEDILGNYQEWNIAEGTTIWKDWTVYGVNLSNYNGQPINFRLSTYDCIDGYHYGYAYVAFDCVHTPNADAHDTVIIHDTVFVNVPVHDTTYVEIHDTTYINVPVHDTTIVIDTIVLTEYVPVHDTITNYIYDTTIVVDTLWMTQYDTIWLHDTVMIHDTIYIHDESIESVEVLNAKIYQRNGLIVVESGDGESLGEVRVFDVIGRNIAAEGDAAGRVSTDGMKRYTFEVPTSGTYVVKIGNNTTRKIVVIK